MMMMMITTTTIIKKSETLTDKNHSNTLKNKVGNIFFCVLFYHSFDI